VCEHQGAEPCAHKLRNEIVGIDRKDFYVAEAEARVVEQQAKRRLIASEHNITILGSIFYQFMGMQLQNFVSQECLLRINLCKKESEKSIPKKPSSHLLSSPNVAKCGDPR